MLPQHIVLFLMGMICFLFSMPPKINKGPQPYYPYWKLALLVLSCGVITYSAIMIAVKGFVLLFL